MVEEEEEEGGKWPQPKSCRPMEGQRGTDESEDKGEMKKKVGGRMVGRRGTERISGGLYCSVGSWKEAAEVEGQLKVFRLGRCRSCR